MELRSIRDTSGESLPEERIARPSRIRYGHVLGNDHLNAMEAIQSVLNGTSIIYETIKYISLLSFGVSDGV
jgi:hypothetical protein